MATSTMTQTQPPVHASSDFFLSSPPFPSDVPTAPLLRLSLAKLLERDRSELSRFSRACEELGFFYLDLSDSDTLGGPLLSDANKLFSVAEDLLDKLPVEEKKKYDFSAQKSYFGYKGQGAAIVDKKGNLDRNEFYNVSKDDILGISSPWPAPDVIQANRPLLKSFIESAHALVLIILELLNTSLALPPSTLQNLHRINAGSGDQVRFVKAPPQPASDRRLALGEHTDFGSVTVLFNRLGGLQVLPPGKNAEWCYVKPLPGHAIINLGDAMSKFSNGVLRSNIHRVIAPPGAQGDFTRYSLVYFSRPEDEVVLKRLDSERIPPLPEGEEEEQAKSKDWIIRRALGSRIALNGSAEGAASQWDRWRGTEKMSRRDGA